MKKAHAELSASGSHRWLNCPGSIEATKDLPEETSKYAEEGTKAHALLERWIKHLIKSDREFPMPKGYPKDMVNAVGIAMKEVDRQWQRGENGQLEAETRVSLAFIEESMFGTTDWRIVEHFGVLRVYDYKHGAGVAVDVTEDKGHNTQLIYYALGTAHEFDYDFEAIEIGIVQPRAIHHAGPVRTARLTVPELKGYAELFKRGVERTKKKNAKRFAGPWCQFCRAKKTCEAFKKVSQSGAAMAFASIGEV